MALGGGEKLTTSVSWLGIGSLIAAGIVHFVCGRLLAFISYRLIGANQASPILSFSMVFGTMLGIIFFDDPLTIKFVFAFLLIVGGIITIGTAGESKVGKLTISRRTMVKGVTAALGAAICWGVSPALVKIGLNQGSSEFLGVAISYIASLVAAVILALLPQNKEKIIQLERKSLFYLTIGSFFVTIAHMLRYIALDYITVSAVSLIMGTTTIFVFPLSFIINREIEAFTPRIIAGATATIIGVVLMFWIV
jgi:drug/metabolite transporter (DMT)-like permease